MASTATAPLLLQRAGEFTNGIGSNLNDIANKDVALIGYTIGERNVFDQRQDATVARTFVEVEIQELEDGQPNGMTKRYHAWSPALGERLSAIPPSSLPVLARFHQVKTANGFAAWILD
jgi:hypothetical protein